MMNPKFSYPLEPPIDASKLAYDLALIYARAKFEEELRTSKSTRFDGGPSPREQREAAFLESQFFAAYAHYMGLETGDFERDMDSWKPN